MRVFYYVPCYCILGQLCNPVDAMDRDTMAQDAAACSQSLETKYNIDVVPSESRNHGNLNPETGCLLQCDHIPWSSAAAAAAATVSRGAECCPTSL